MTLAETVEEVELGLDEDGAVRVVALKGRGTAREVRRDAKRTPPS